MKKQLLSLLLICSFSLFSMETPQLEQPSHTKSPEPLDSSQNDLGYVQLATEFSKSIERNRKNTEILKNKIDTLKAENKKLEAHLRNEDELRRRFIFNPIHELGNNPVPITGLLAALHLSGVAISSQYGAFSPKMLQVTVENQNGKNGHPLDIDIDVDPIVEEVKRTLPFSQRHPRIVSTATFGLGMGIMGALCWKNSFQEHFNTVSSYCNPVISRLSTLFNR